MSHFHRPRFRVGFDHFLRSSLDCRSQLLRQQPFGKGRDDCQGGRTIDKIAQLLAPGEWLRTPRSLERTVVLSFRLPHLGTTVAQLPTPPSPPFIIGEPYTQENLQWNYLFATRRLACLCALPTPGRLRTPDMNRKTAEQVQPLKCPLGRRYRDVSDPGDWLRTPVVE